MSIVAYCRVSSREQAENSHALEQQIARVKQAGAEQVFTDVESGSRDDREAFGQLMELVGDRQITEVIITRLDRLSRSLLTLRKTIAKFQECEVVLRALDDALDTSTAAGKFHLNMLGALAEMETDRLSERVRHGWNHLRDKQVAMNPPFGYCKVENHLELDYQPILCLLSDETERSKAAIARHIIDTFLEKRSLRLCLREINIYYGIYTFAHTQHGKRKAGRVARELFRFSPGGLSRWLTSPVIRGHLCYLRKRGGKQQTPDKWEIKYNTHISLITEAEYREIEEILSHNRQHRGYGSTAMKYPTSGLIFCGECRAACYSVAGNRGNQPGYNHYYQCKNWATRSCDQKQMIRHEKIEDAIVQALKLRAEQISVKALITEQQVEPLALQELRSQLHQLTMIPNPNKAISSAIKDLQTQIVNYQVRTQVKEGHKQGDRELLHQIFSKDSYWQTLASEDKKLLYRQLVDSVVVKDGEVKEVLLKV